jgi:hypothetical protein
MLSIPHCTDNWLTDVGKVVSPTLRPPLYSPETFSSETSVLTRATRRNNPEDTILHSHRRENLKSYTLFLCLWYSFLLAAE